MFLATIYPWTTVACRLYLRGRMVMQLWKGWFGEGEEVLQKFPSLLIWRT